jgi:large subunit ribosomal protein L3
MKLPGHMGDRQVTVKNLEVVEVRGEENLLLVKGAVPGGPNAFLVVQNRASDFAQRKEEAPPQPKTDQPSAEKTDEQAA